jgi:hypothetical protein
MGVWVEERNGVKERIETQTKAYVSPQLYRCAALTQHGAPLV